MEARPRSGDSGRPGEGGSTTSVPLQAAGGTWQREGAVPTGNRPSPFLGILGSQRAPVLPSLVSLWPLTALPIQT